MKKIQRNKTTIVITAWLVMLIVSDLPDIILAKMGNSIPPQMFWIKTGFLAVFLIVTYLWKTIRSLWQYAVIFLTLYLALSVTGMVRNTGWFQSNFNYEGVSFLLGYSAIFILDILVALSVLAALWLMSRDRVKFFFVKGQIDAPIEPVRWLGIKEGESWKVFGWIFAIIAGIGVAIPTIIGVAPTNDIVMKSLPLLPVAILLAAVNAFTEEAYYRCSLLSTLHGEVGKTNTLLLTSTYFGLGHWLYGSPPGLIGFLMVGFLAWLLGKAMLETKGFLWPWFIHFVPDVVIFYSYVLLFVQS